MFKTQLSVVAVKGRYEGAIGKGDCFFKFKAI